MGRSKTWDRANSGAGMNSGMGADSTAGLDPGVVAESKAGLDSIVG